MTDAPLCPKCGGTKLVPHVRQVAAVHDAAKWAIPVAVVCCDRFHDKPGANRVAYHPNR